MASTQTIKCTNCGIVLGVLDTNTGAFKRIAVGNYQQQEQIVPVDGKEALDVLESQGLKVGMILTIARDDVARPLAVTKTVVSAGHQVAADSKININTRVEAVVAENPELSTPDSNIVVCPNCGQKNGIF